MLIGVFQGAPIRYAIYVGYEHHPTLGDADALRGAGVTVMKPYESIDYIRSEASYAQIERIVNLPGVRRVEAIPMMYRVNHIATRTTRVRSSWGFRLREDGTYFSERSIGSGARRPRNRDRDPRHGRE